MVSVSRATTPRVARPPPKLVPSWAVPASGGVGVGAAVRRDGRNHHDARSVAARRLPPAQACAGIGIGIALALAAVPHA